MQNSVNLILLVFHVGAQRYAVNLESVERVLPMIAIVPLPEAPEVILGLIRVEGSLVPAVSLRRRFGMESRKPEIEDQLLLVNTGRRKVALWIDRASEVIERNPKQIVPTHTLMPGLRQIVGVAPEADSLVLIHDLEQCLSEIEEGQIHTAMAKLSNQSIAQ